MWVPAAHVGIACNAYADAVATAYLGNNDTEDASKVVREAVRTRPCMYTARRKATEDTETREIVDRRTYEHMRQSAHEWVCEQYRKTTKPTACLLRSLTERELRERFLGGQWSTIHNRSNIVYQRDRCGSCGSGLFD